MDISKKIESYYKAKTIVNHAIRNISDSHQTILVDKSLKWDFGMSEDAVLDLIAEIQYETGSEISFAEMQEYKEDITELTVNDLYQITKDKLTNNDSDT